MGRVWLAAACAALGLMSACDHSPFADPAKACVAPETFGQLLEIVFADGKTWPQLHRDKLALSSADAVLVSFDKMTRKISCRGSILVKDQEHGHEMTANAVDYTIQPTADGKSTLYEVSGPGAGALSLQLIELDMAAQPAPSATPPAEASAPAEPAASDAPAASDQLPSPASPAL